MSYSTSTIGAFDGTQSSSGSNGPTLRPFANLDLTEDQRKQIRQILQTAQSQGTSQSNVQTQIDAVLTPEQQQLLQADLAQLQAAQSSNNGLPPEFDNLDLTADQQSQIQSILAKAKSQGLSPDQVKSEINSVLTTAQLTKLQQNVQNAQAANAGQGTCGPDAGSSTTSDASATSNATLPNGVTEADIQKQIAAALSVVLQQIHSEIGPSSAAAGSTAATTT